MIHLAISFDNNYLVQAYALLTSIFLNNRDTSFHIHCIARNINKKEKEGLNEYTNKNNSQISFYNVEESLIEKFPILSHWNTSPYLKIFFPLLIDETIERILYLDTDMLVVGKLKTLYEIDMQDYPLAAVADPYVKSEAYWELHKKENYFNSGMMLIDSKKWKSLNISEKCLKILKEEPEKIIYVDQDALNIALEDNYLLVPEKYNYMYTHIDKTKSIKPPKKQLENIVVLHFTISRPWHFLCKNPYGYLYAHYLKKSPKKKEKAITDFSYSKILPYIRIKIIEFYLNTPILKKIWSFIKSI